MLDSQMAPIEVFCSYVRGDESLFRKLEIHLSGLKRQGLISTWQKHLILPGAKRAQEIDAQLNTALIFLLLISADFLASDYCFGIEMTRALERHSANEARMIPILVRPCDWSHAPFAHLQCLPRDCKPITTWSDRDLAFKDITIQLRKVVEELQEAQMNIRLHQEKVVQKHHLQTFLGSSVDGQAYPLAPHALPQFRLCQKKVSELKSVHNMLHEIEVQLGGLSATIQLLMRDGSGEKEINQHLFDFGYIEIMWQQVVLKIDDLAYFATEVIETLEDERLSFDSNTIRGAPWVKDLFILQRSFEVGIRDRNITIVKNVSNELLIKCRSHLYRIDRRLLEAVKELDLSSDLILRGRT